jgi:aldose 1-epimerase
MKITAGEAELVLAPEMGGSVVSWTVSGRPLFRPADPAATGARMQSCYPLVPFSNRVAGGRFSFAGRDYTLPILLGTWAIHGAGWCLPWSVDGHTMRLDYPGGELWPFAFEAEQHFDLRPDRLIVTMRITSRHDAPAPAAIGLHPFFPRGADTRLELPVSGVWLSDANKIPERLAELPAEWDFRAEHALGDVDVDHCFTGWDGRYAITWPDRHERLVVTAGAPFGHIVFYVPRGQNFFAVEPVSNMNDGLNHMTTGDDHGMRILAPGETLEGRISMVIEPMAAAE